jgi:transcriptional regulator with XRE-family HTH domain
MKSDKLHTYYSDFNSEISFGQLLKKIRLNNSITMKDLSKSSGVSQSYISQLESGVRLPSKDVVHKLAHSLINQYKQTDMTEEKLFNNLWDIKQKTDFKNTLNTFNKVNGTNTTNTLNIFSFKTDPKSQEIRESISNIFGQLSSEQLKEVYDFARFLLESNNHK